MKIKKIFYTSHFLRSFKKLPSALRSEIMETERAFRANSFDPRLKTHKLSGRLKGYWSFSITSSHRILFAIEGDGSVTFVDVGDHSIYQ